MALIPATNSVTSTALSATYLFRFIPRCAFLQDADEMTARGRNGNAVAQNDLPGGDLTTIDILIGIVVWAERRAFERNSREEAACARVAQNLGAQRRVRR